MKLLILFMFGCGIYLLLPTFDLVQVEDSFSENQTTQLIDKGFITENRCKKAIKVQKLEHAHCLKTSPWKNIFSKSRQYNTVPERYTPIQ